MSDFESPIWSAVNNARLAEQEFQKEMDKALLLSIETKKVDDEQNVIRMIHENAAAGYICHSQPSIPSDDELDKEHSSEESGETSSKQ